MHVVTCTGHCALKLFICYFTVSIDEDSIKEINLDCVLVINIERYLI